MRGGPKAVYRCRKQMTFRLFEQTWFGSRTGRQFVLKAGARMPLPSTACEWFGIDLLLVQRVRRDAAGEKLFSDANTRSCTARCSSCPDQSGKRGRLWPLCPAHS